MRITGQKRRPAGRNHRFLPSHPEARSVRGFRLRAAASLVKQPAARYPGGMPTRRPYPSDLSDARWALVEPTLTAWRQRERWAGLSIGRPPRHDLRSVLDAILSADRTGIPWRYLPREYPPCQTVYYYFARWPQDGVFGQPSGLLRRLTRIAAGRGPEPAADVAGSQRARRPSRPAAADQGRRRAPFPPQGPVRQRLPHHGHRARRQARHRPLRSAATPPPGDSPRCPAAGP